MPYRITKTTDAQHVGVVLETVEQGNVITFEDGDVVVIEQVFTSNEGAIILVSSANYQMTLIRE